MKLAPGVRLGPYELSAPLGAGGMGEVYRARDTRLGRDVALKVLGEEVASDPARLRRFEHEARAASALSHPNIVTVYEIGVADSVPYIAMEYIAGKTLRDVCRSGPLPIKRLLDLAVQIARGLARAHEAGIVHRDLKPENIIVSRDGVVKILDFGLAKLSRSPVEGGAGGALSTATAGTQPGVLLGTYGYMSPEQARGLAVDFRSDQFSFGSVLYEMAAGRRAFEGKTSMDTLSAVLNAEPEPVARADLQLPPPLRWIIERCLVKDPKDRYSATEDLSRELASVRDHLAEVSGIRGASPGPAPTRVRRLRWAAAAAVLAAAGLVAGLILGGRRRSAEPPSFRQLTFRAGEVLTANFAPDGQTIIYSAAWGRSPLEIFMHRLGSPESRPLGMSGAAVFSVSRSGEMALSINGTLARMGLASVGSPREILEHVDGADWSPDGRELAVAHDVEGRSTLEYPIGRVLFREAAGYLDCPRVSRDGTRVAFASHPVRNDQSGSIAVVDLSGNRRILATGFNFVGKLGWSPDGSEVWFTAAPTGLNESLYAVSLTGRQRLLARVMGAMELQDVSPSGRVLVTHGKVTEHVMALPPGEDRERDLTWLDSSLSRALSNDGRNVLLFESGEGGGEDNSIFLRKTDGSAAVRLGEGVPWALSPDGRWAAAYLPKAGVIHLVLYATGAGETRSIPLRGLEPQSAEWLPDGKRILFPAGQNGHAPRLYIQSVAGGPPRAISADGYRSFEGTVSPDGKLVIVEGPDQKILLYPIDGGSPAPLPGVEATDIPRGWSGDGHYVYVTGNSYTIPRKVDRIDVKTGQREPWKELGPETGAVGIHIALDDRSYVYSFVRKQADLYLAEGLR